MPEFLRLDTVAEKATAVTFANCTYTANGELTGKTNINTSQTTTYDYDVFANLRSATLPNGDVLSYQIDGRNRRIGKRINGVKVQGFVYMNQLEPVAETDGDGNRVATFIYADRANVPSYLLKGGNTYRVIADHLGSVRLVLDVADGTIAQRMDYDAWGNVINDTNPGFQPFGYAGGLYDRDLELVRFGARDYDPELGRWTAKDPSGFSSKRTNFYSYAANNPTLYTDSSGNEPEVLSYLTPGSIDEAAAAKFTITDDVIYIIGHGNENAIDDHREGSTDHDGIGADIVQDDIRRLPGYSEDKPIIFLSCKAGKDRFDGSDGLAERVSDWLPNDVIATNGSVKVGEDGLPEAFIDSNLNSARDEGEPDAGFTVFFNIDR